MTPIRPTTLAVTLALLAFASGGGGAAAARQRSLPPPRRAGDMTVVLSPAVRDSMGAIFRRSNAHWDELQGENTLTQMLGTGRPTQLEYLGCLRGRVIGDTVWVDETVPAHDMRRFQFAVTGNCERESGVVGTWHTHPFRAAPEGGALKERELSPTDLSTFSHGADRAVVAVWDVDSLDVAARAPNGAVRHPAALVVR